MQDAAKCTLSIVGWTRLSHVKQPRGSLVLGEMGKLVECQVKAKGIMIKHTDTEKMPELDRWRTKDEEETARYRPSSSLLVAVFPSKAACKNSPAHLPLNCAEKTPGSLSLSWVNPCLASSAQFSCRKSLNLKPTYWSQLPSELRS